MKPWRSCAGLVGVVLLGLPGQAAAQAPEGSAAGGVIVVLLALLVVLGVGVKLLDLARKRKAEAVALQAHVSDALLRDERLFRLAVTATAHVGYWRGSPATLELNGQVPAPELREAALRVAGEEARRVRPDVQIADRLAVTPVAARAA